MVLCVSGANLDLGIVVAQCKRRGGKDTRAGKGWSESEHRVTDGD